MPLHPQAVQIYLQAKGAEQQEKMANQYGQVPGGFGGNGQNKGENSDMTDNAETSDEDREGIEKSLRALDEFRRVTNRQIQVVRHVIE